MPIVPAPGSVVPRRRGRRVPRPVDPLPLPILLLLVAIGLIALRFAMTARGPASRPVAAGAAAAVSVPVSVPTAPRLLTILFRAPQPERPVELPGLPPGAGVVSSYALAGLGQLVTVRVPADRIPDLERTIEREAAHPVEFYPTEPTPVRAP